MHMERVICRVYTLEYSLENSQKPLPCFAPYIIEKRYCIFFFKKARYLLINTVYNFERKEIKKKHRIYSRFIYGEAMN